MTKNIQNEYRKDFYAWTIHNAKLLREGKLSEVDIEHIAEEIESMGKSERRELINRLAVLIAHLLKWQFQEERRSNSWKYTIEEQRDEVLELVEESPSLNHEINEKLYRAYRKAILWAATEMGVNKSIFKDECPFSLEKILNKDFYPED
jgi:vacuolar-type H+-ATPase subunit C/Vma6